MNKHIVKYLLALATIAFVGGGCNVDDYNEEYLDGFNPDKEITDVQVLKYTMTDADYASVASNAANKAIAEAAGPDAVAALAAVGTAKCFSEAASATTYLPAFLAAGYDSYLSNGSTVTVTYKNQRGEISEAITGIASASTYELKAADYEVAWGEDITADYFTPGKPAANYLPRILKEAVKNAEAGDYVIAEYAYSEQEPSTGGGEIPETINKISEIIAPGDYTVQGTVSAAYARGFIVDDTTGAILVYLNAPSNYSLGDVVKVKGAVTEYNSGMQFGNTAEITLVEKTKNFAFPTAQAMSGSELDAYLTAASIKFVSLTGTLSISGNYYNLNVDGAATATGSLSFPNKGQIDGSLDGKKVTATGYLFSVSKSGGAPKFANMIVATIAEEGSQPEFTPVGIVASADPGTFSVKGQVAATYKRGFLINDGTGSILIYTNVDPTGTYAIGDLVSVEGTTSAYAGLNQYPPASTVTKLNTEANKFTYPAIREMDGTDMDGYLTLTTAQYVRYTGTLKIDGNYYNVINDEALTAQGSLSYVLDGAVDPALDGQEVVVEGYAIGVSGSKFLNTMVTSVKPAANASAASFGMTRAAVTKNRYAIYTSRRKHHDGQPRGLHADGRHQSQLQFVVLAGHLPAPLPEVQISLRPGRGEDERGIPLLRLDGQGNPALRRRVHLRRCGLDQDRGHRDARRPVQEGQRQMELRPQHDARRGPRPQRLQQELLPGLRGLGTPEQGRRLYDGQPQRQPPHGCGVLQRLRGKLHQPELAYQHASEILLERSR